MFPFQHIIDGFKLKRQNRSEGADQPAFVGSDANIYMGIGLFSSVYEDSRLTVTRPADTHENAVVYALWPASYTPEGEVVWTEKGYTLTKLN